MLDGDDGDDVGCGSVEVYQRESSRVSEEFIPRTSPLERIYRSLPLFEVCDKYRMKGLKSQWAGTTPYICPPWPEPFRPTPPCSDRRRPV